MSPSGQPCPRGLIDVTWRVLLVAIVCLLALCDGYVNVARGKPAQQVDTYTIEGSTKADRAVDGMSDMAQAGCTHTMAERNTWWIVDFHKDYLVHAARITNRNTDPERLQQFKVQVSQQNPLKHAGFPTSLPGRKCFYRDAPISGDVPETIPCSSPIIGRYLTLFKAANSILAICELEALATNVTQQQLLFQAVPNKRKQTKPFFIRSRARSGLDCLSLCARQQNGTATVAQYRGSDGLCECIQFSYFDDPQPSDVDSPGWVMYASKYN